MLFYRRKVKYDLSQKIHGNVILSVYSVKMVFLFPQIWYYLSNDNIRTKNALKDDISGIIEKDNIHSREYGISSDRKIKDDKKAYFCKKVAMILHHFMEISIGVSIYCFPTKKQET